MMFYELSWTFIGAFMVFYALRLRAKYDLLIEMSQSSSRVFFGKLKDVPPHLLPTYELMKNREKWALFALLIAVIFFVLNLVIG